jgi:hypothetical protein
MSARYRRKQVDFEFDVDEIPSVKHDRDRYNTRALSRFRFWAQ